MAIKVYEGERAETAHNNLLGTFTLEGIPPAPRATPQIEVKFDVNANGILSITAEEKQSGRKGEISISPDKVSRLHHVEPSISNLTLGIIGSTFKGGYRPYVEASSGVR